MVVVKPLTAAAAGISINANGGTYKRGKAFDFHKKIALVEKYEELANLANGVPPSIRTLAKAAKVSRDWAKKVINELKSDDGLIDSDSARPQRIKGPGSRSLDSFDIVVLLFLVTTKPQLSLQGYQRELFQRTATIVSRSTISRFWKNGLEIAATLRRPDLVPIDKFKPENLERAVEYIQIVSMIDPHRLKFCDEKSLKGQEVYARKVRRNPITGVTPVIMTDSDFRNTYSITGFCGVDRSTYAVFVSIHEMTNDATDFAISVELAIARGFLKRGDVLVLDNAQIHSGGENEILEDFLLEYFGIHMLWLPTRSPEMNPIELIWNILVQRLRTVDLLSPTPSGHRVAYQAFAILSAITHDEVAACYRKCGYIV
jgi:transposase